MTKIKTEDKARDILALINHNIYGKEYCLQYSKRGFRCISWHPHYIMTDWVKTKEQELADGDKAISEFYNRKIRL